MNPSSDQLASAELKPADVSLDPKPVEPSPKPLLPIAAGLILGIAVDHRVAVPPALSLTLFFLACVIGFADASMSRIIERMRIRLPRARRLLAAVIVASISLGLLRHAIADRFYATNDVTRWLKDEPALVRLSGVVATAPRIVEPDSETPRAYPTPPRTRFLLNTDEIEDVSGPVSASGRIAVTVKEPVLRVAVGSRVTITGWLHAFQSPQNPGAYDWNAHFARQGIHAALSTDHAAAVTLLDGSSESLTGRWIDAARARLLGYLVNTAFPDDDENAGVIAAMVLARRSVVSDALNEAFLRTGCVHFLAASGMNVAWLALVGWGISRVIGLHYRRAAPLVAAMIATFVLLAEPQPSILRAGIVGVLACLAIYFRGRYHPTNSLALSAIILLLINPMDLYGPGFQLTFVATIGLFHVFPPFSNAMARMISLRLRRPAIGRLFVVESPGTTLAPSHPAERDRLESVLPPWCYRLARLSAQALSLALAEWIITTPLACYHFNTLAPWGALCTFLIAPLAMITSWLGFLMLLAGLLFPTLGRLFGMALAPLTRLMLALVAALARLPGSLLDGRSPSAVWTLAVYGVILLWLRPSRGGRRNWRIALPAATLALIAWWFVAPMVVRHRGGALRIWMLAVGDGTGTVIELPNGKTLIFDFGTRSGFDASIVARDFFRYRGITSIDAAFVTHSNFDHYGAIVPIARHTPIRELIVNDQFVSFAQQNSGAARFLKSMEGLGIPVRVSSGDARFNFDANVAMYSVWPPAASAISIPTDNDASTVLRIEYLGQSVLLTGDIAEIAETSLMSRNAATTDRSQLNANVLALPHHGSVVGSTRAFIEAVDPQYVVRSSGQGRATTMNGIASIVGTARTYFNTADDGGIVITIDAGQLRVDRCMGPR